MDKTDISPVLVDIMRADGGIKQNYDSLKISQFETVALIRNPSTDSRVDEEYLKIGEILKVALLQLYEFYSI